MRAWDRSAPGSRRCSGPPAGCPSTSRALAASRGRLHYNYTVGRRATTASFNGLVWEGYIPLPAFSFLSRLSHSSPGFLRDRTSPLPTPNQS